MSASGDGSAISGWADLSLPPVLQAFTSSPQNFILGAVLSGILEWLFGTVSLVIDVILLVVAGSEPATFDAPGEQLGIADIPVSVANNLGGVGETAGTAIIAGIEAFNEPIFEAAAFAGPASPLIFVLIIIIETTAVLWLLQRAVYVAADLLQLGGLTE
ncbi:hypothetical protein [Halorubrum sp. N11]|uniref:hypothetical protein n=1 Tax=Halorubrum sp. N11 TaxID=3402276 RepID=UPI003EBB58EF